MIISKINIFWAFALCLFFVSCEKEIEFKGEVTASRLVINAFITADEPISAMLGKSVFFMDDSSNYNCPDDAQMTLYVNGEFVETLCSFGNQFNGNYVPAVGDTIRLVATAPDFDDVKATTYAVPDAPSYTYNTVTEHFGNASYTIEDTVYYYIHASGYVTIDLHDTNPNIRDCYRVTIKESELYDLQTITCDDPIFENMSGSLIEDIYSSSRDIFIDKIFDGSHYEIKIPFEVETKSDTIYHNEAEFEIILEHIDLDLYKYYNTLYAEQENPGFFSEPVQIHSNVEGGYGIVAGRNCETIKVIANGDK